MRQYFEGRENLTLNIDDKVKFDKTEYQDIILANERVDAKWDVKNKIFNNCTFSNLGLCKATNKSVNFAHSVFIDCYFRKAKFDAVDFTGALFINCNFEQAVFINCIFDYARFSGCFIAFDVIKANLPRNMQNLNRDLCRNLGIECLKLGQDREYRKFYFEEKRANEKYYWDKAICFMASRESYYNKYNFWDSIDGIFHFILSKVNKILWGYGEKLSRLIFNIIFTISIFSVLYRSGDIVNSGTQPKDWFECFYISLCNFITISPVSKYVLGTPYYELLSVTEAVMGVVLMGFFVAAIFRYINRRG